MERRDSGFSVPTLEYRQSASKEGIMAKIKKIKLPNETSAREVCDNGAVRFDEKGNLTEAQKTVARANIGVEEYKRR